MNPERAVTVHVQVGDARELRKLEARMWKLGKIISVTYLYAPDEWGRYTVHSANYVVVTSDPRRLRIMLTQLENNMKASISF